MIILQQLFCVSYNVICVLCIIYHVYKKYTSDVINNNSITECKQVFIVAVWIVYDRPPSQGDDKAARGVTGTFRFNQSNQRRS